MICNNLPFSLAGLGHNFINSKLSKLNHKTILKYIGSLLNISSIPYSPYLFSETEKNASEYIINEVLTFSKKGLKKQNLSILFSNSCQDIINSCTINGSIQSSFNCCEKITMNIGTLNGLCLTFNNDILIKNIHLKREGNVGIIFQISRNSFNFNGISTHPGLSIYLIDEKYNDNKLQIQKSEHYTLNDKKGLKLFLKKNEKINNMKVGCGYSYHNAPTMDAQWESPLECLIEAGIKDCGCHPLISEYFIKNDSYLNDLLQNTPICLMDQEYNCFYQYFYYSFERNFYDDQINDGVLKGESISKCLRKYSPTCYKSTYESRKHDYTLTTDYNSTNDFVAEFQISYESLTVHRDIYSYRYDTFYLLSSILYNFAFWFLIPLWITLIIYIFSIRADKTYTTVEHIDKGRVKPTPSIANINLEKIERNKTFSSNVNSVTDHYNLFVPRNRTTTALGIENEQISITES
uniref:Recep_L_domain domain-containing protein n=1 Tax=Parastrongyloides trichosuri TaxID=131310 RepID=A0A0N4Z1T0_PARTI